MFIINADTIPRFRLAISKIIFISLYSKDFKFNQKTSPFEDENDFIDAKESNTGTHYHIYLYNKPKKYKLNQDYNIVVYNLSKKTKDNNGIEYRLLSNEFVKTLNDESNNGFAQKSNSKYYKKFKPNSFKSAIFYKYYSNNQNVDIFTKRACGDVSFVNPIVFNDPFDCDYYDIIMRRKKDSFKALCLAQNYDNILMWSYYSNDHKGYCLGYDLKEILTELSKVYSGLCIIGNIRYDLKRPTIYKTKKLSSFNEICFLIQCTFTKFLDWEHEKEFRVLILDNKPKEEYKTINVPIKESYIGIKSNLKSCAFKPKPIKLLKDNKTYKLYKE